MLFDYDPSRGGAVPLRLLEGYRGILLTDGYGAYDGRAEALGLVHAGCMAHARREFDEAKKAASDGPATPRSRWSSSASCSWIERPLWDRDHPVTAEQRVRIRSRTIRTDHRRSIAWLEASCAEGRAAEPVRQGGPLHARPVAEAHRVPHPRRGAAREQPLRERDPAVCKGALIVHLIFKCLKTLKSDFPKSTRHGRPLRASAEVTRLLCRSVARIW